MNKINIPNTVSTTKDDSVSGPQLLSADSSCRYHGLSAVDHVMWSTPTVVMLEGGDSIRDSSAAGSRVIGVTRYYATLADWLAAGNQSP